MGEEKRDQVTLSIPKDLEYFASISNRAWTLLKKYHNVLLFRGAIVKSDPVFLHSKQTGNDFAKFTVMFDSPFPWRKKKFIEHEKRGDVYVDCFAYENKRKSPGDFILQNICKGAVISGCAVLKSGRKPVKGENDEYRANWVYGDYVYINVFEVTVDRIIPMRGSNNPYNDVKSFSPYYSNYGKSSEIKDDEIIFNL